MPQLLTRLTSWLRHKAVPSALGGTQWTGTEFVDAFKRNRVPTPNEMLAELKNTAFTCASINAAVCASYNPRLFVWSTTETPQPRCTTKALSGAQERRLERRLRLRTKRSHAVPPKTHRQIKIEEVVDHPLLDLFDQPNPQHSSFDLWELTTFYQETAGSAYWLLQFDNLGTPNQIWVLPAQNVTPKRQPQSRAIVDYYEYRSGMQRTTFKPAEIIHFRYPDPKDPYTAGLSPLRACWEQVALTSDYLAFKKATWENSAVPGAVISPDDVLGEEERDRLETQWNNKFRRGGAGRVLVAESGLKVTALGHSMGDLAALAEYGATKEDIANAFHVPLSYLTSNTNLANLEAAEQQHLSLAVSPRLWRRDEKINQQLLPLFDPSGRLFVASDDPMNTDTDDDPTWFDLNMKHGITTINEVRLERGMGPVPWGDKPWLPLTLAPYDFPEGVPQGASRADFMHGAGRNTDPAHVVRREQEEEPPST
jgi:HK97 family phage portal protein